MVSRVAGAVLLAPALALAACPGAGEYDDFYRQVAWACDYTEPEVGRPLELDERAFTTLRPECADALNAILPIDESSFADAPPGYRNKVLEAFQVLVGYPLALDRDLEMMDGVPLKSAHLCVLDPDRFGDACGLGPAWEAIEPVGGAKRLNQNVFNFVVNKIDTIRFQSLGPNLLGRFVLGQLILTDIYWAPTGGSSWLSTPFVRAGVLVHEARHGDGNTHVRCDRCGLTSWSCDPDLSGPYGLEIAYWSALMRGSAVRGPDGEPPRMSSYDVAFVGFETCDKLRARFVVDMPEVGDLLDPTPCGSHTDREILAWYGLESPWEEESNPFTSARGLCHDEITAGGCSFEVRVPPP